MNEVTPTPEKFETYKLIAPLVGAVLSIIGGFFAVIIRSRVEKKSEIEYIKISLIDELHEICAILTKMSETYKTTHIISNVYLNDLAKNTESFTHNKQRLFLIKEEELRRLIVSFYKNIGEKINESINKVNKLGEVQVGNEHDLIVSNFAAILESATSLKTRITKYKFCSFWIF